MAGLSTGLFGVLWNYVGGYIIKMLPEGIQTIVAVNNEDKWAAFGHNVYLGLGSWFVLTQVLNGSILRRVRAEVGI